MFKNLKRWWFRRKAEYYLKHNWHIIVDVVLSLVIIGLLINLLFIYSRNSNKIVSFDPVEHKPFEQATTTVEHLKLESNLEKNNIYLGADVELSIFLENNGEVDLKNIEIKPIFVNSNFSASALSVKSGNAKIENGKIFLESLSSDNNQEIVLSLKINSRNKALRLVDWGLEAKYLDEAGEMVLHFEMPALKIITDLKVSGAAYYNSQLGDQLGSGPIPPIVGIPTNYWVFFEVNDFYNDLNNFAISAKLADGVTLSNRKTLTAGDFSYNENQKRITWTIKELDVSGNNYKMGFEVQLLPSDKKIGQTPTLVDNISYLATDSYTGQYLNGRLNLIDTSLPFDVINQGQGEVIE